MGLSMDGFLVLLRMAEDDVPLRLFGGVKEALDFVNVFRHDMVGLSDELSKYGAIINTAGDSLESVLGFDILEYKDGTVVGRIGPRYGLKSSNSAVM